MAREPAKVTTDHEFIRDWVERRGGCPAAGRTGGRRAVVRIEYTRGARPTHVPIGWDEFFDWFERQALAFQYDRARARFVDRASIMRSARGRR